MYLLYTEPREDRGTVIGGPAELPMMLHGGGGQVMLAFATKALAESFRIGSDMAGGDILSILDLPTRDPLWDERPEHILLFSTAEDIASFKQDRERFPIDQHIFRLDKAMFR